MFDIGTLTTAATIVIGVLTWAVMTHILGDADPIELTAMFGRPWEPDWPLGVQEEEPFHWRLDPVPEAGARLLALVPLAECEDCPDEAAA
jgi:hypothetical protein